MYEFLICLTKNKEGKLCSNTSFRIKKTENGLIVVCTECKAEHEVKAR
jgi:hypothetical protein